MPEEADFHPSVSEDRTHYDFFVNGQEYVLYEGKPIIKSAEALKIFNTFVLPYKQDSAGFKVLKQWNVSQTRLL